MIVITDVNVMETEQNFVEIAHKTGPSDQTQWLRDGEDVMILNSRETRELIRGRRFVRPKDGVDVVLGLSEKVQNLLGLQYEAFDNLQAENERLRGQVRIATKLHKEYYAKFMRTLRPWYVKLYEWLWLPW